MPPFRHRPLCWLFLIATACLDLVAFTTNHELAWVDALTVGQAMVAGGWLVLGGAHRLARAGVFLAVIVLLASPDFYDGNGAGEWAYVLGTLAALGLGAALATGGWRGLERLALGTPAPLPAVRFTIAEILGWMIVVAAGCTLLRVATFEHLAHSRPMAAVIVGLAVAAGALMVVSHPSDRPRPLGGILVGAAVVVLMFWALPRFIPPEAVRSHLGSFAFVGLWAVVQRLDAAFTAVRAEPTLRVVAP